MVALGIGRFRRQAHSEISFMSCAYPLSQGHQTDPRQTIFIWPNELQEGCSIEGFAVQNSQGEAQAASAYEAA